MLPHGRTPRLPGTTPSPILSSKATLAIIVNREEERLQFVPQKFWTVEAEFDNDGSHYQGKWFTTSKEDRWEVFDAGVCCQTFCLAAHDAGLGTVIMGVYDEKDVADAVGLPEGQIASCLIALGYPDQDPSAPKRKEVSELLTFK